MAELRTGTEAKHASAEGHPFQRALAKGQLSKSSYVAYLHQLTHVHRSLEAALRDAATADPRIASVAQRLQSRVPDLGSDTAALGASDVEPASEPARQLMDRISVAAKSLPMALLGMHYVLEGSKNGGRFIARALRRAYALPENLGTRYMDPHGDAQRDHWLDFKALMDGLTLSAEERRLIVDGAGQMFDGIGSISQELVAAVPA